MQSPVARQRAVGEVRTDRADGGAKASAHPIAGGDVRAHARIPRVTGIEEAGHAPVIPDPARVFDAADDQPPAAHDRAVVLYADALEGVAAHRLVAAGAKQERAWYALADLRAHGADLAAQQEIVAPRQVEKERRARQASQEGLGRQRIG